MPKLQRLALAPRHKSSAFHTAKSRNNAGIRYTLRSHLPHVAPDRLADIISQVHAEGYHVEYISRFSIDGVSMIETIDAVTRWANQQGLKVSINEERGICFFERL